MAGRDSFGFDTLSLHAGQQPDPTTGARAVPIFQTTSFVFRDTQDAAELFDLGQAGHIYSRISNPTVAVLEERLAALDGGIGAICTASGQAALFLAVSTLMGQGGHIVSSASLYGGSRTLLAHTLPRFGIDTTFVDPRDTEAFSRAIGPRTGLLFAEVLGNPGLEVADISRLADIAHEAGVPLLIDATFATPYLLQPLAHGADLVLHSATKWLGGHGVSIGGAIIDAGRFDWAASGRFPTLTEPSPAYHGTSFAEEFGPLAFLMRARAEGLRDFGASMNPTAAFHILQGIETLPHRMRGHMENTRKILDFLVDASGNPETGVAWVRHPSLPDHPDHALAQRLFPRGAGAVICFGIAGGRAAGARFIESLGLFSHLANVGDAKSLVIHPASTTHRQLDAEALSRIGLGDDLIRLSIGLEDADDLIADLAQALRAARKGGQSPRATREDAR